MADARFDDVSERPLRLLARSAEDLQVISSLVQDAVLTGADLSFRRSARRFSILLNRFRWEDPLSASTGSKRAERVRSILDFADVTGASHQGLSRDKDTVLSLLSVQFEPETAGDADAPAGPGAVILTFAGDGALRLQVECLEVELSDVTRPYTAPSRHTPQHPE